MIRRSRPSSPSRYLWRLARSAVSAAMRDSEGPLRSTAVTSARSSRILVATLVLVAVIGCGGARRDERSAIARAIRTTLFDFTRRDASAFCGDFIPTVAARLGHCNVTVQRAFAEVSDTIEYYGRRELPSGLSVRNIRWQDNRGSATTTWPWPDIRRPASVMLEKRAGRWRIATPFILGDRPNCSTVVHTTVCAHAISVEFRA
jgi:hypothetical protein